MIDRSVFWNIVINVVFILSYELLIDGVFLILKVFNERWVYIFFFMEFFFINLILDVDLVRGDVDLVVEGVVVVVVKLEVVVIVVERNVIVI